MKFQHGEVFSLTGGTWVTWVSDLFNVLLSNKVVLQDYKAVL